ncbi:MAG: hypothetical protein SNI49_09655 [Rikenellaceae bacterium]
MENIDNNKTPIEPTDHELMLSEVYKDDVELLYLDCCFGELLGS